MTVSFTGYEGHGFYCRDRTLQVWVAMLVDAIDAHGPYGGGWLRGLRDCWSDLALLRFEGDDAGCSIALDLDGFASDEGRQRTLLSLCTAARRQLLSGGRPPLGALSRRVGGPFWEEREAFRRVARVADAFIWLLSGGMEVAHRQQADIVAGYSEEAI